MRRTFTLSATGLGLFLIALGIAYISDLSVQTGYFATVFRFYPVLPILLGLDYLCSALPAVGGRIDRPVGWVATLIILITIGGLVYSSVSKLIEPSYGALRDFRFWSDRWWTDQVTARVIEKNFQLPTGVTTVRIENENGDLEIDNTSGKTVTASAELKIGGFMRRRMNRNEAALDLTGEQQGDRFVIRLHPLPGSSASIINRHLPGVATNLSLKLPKGLSVEISSAAGNVKVGSIDGNLTINESAGQINVEQVGGKLEARNSLGAVQIGSVAGDADIKASAGRIEVARIKGAAAVESSLGEVLLLDCGGPVRAKVDKGRLKVNLTNVSGDCNFEVSMGSAEVGISRLAKFSLDAATSMGNIDSDFPISVIKEMTQAKADGPVNGGGPVVRIDASMGSIQLRGI